MRIQTSIFVTAVTMGIIGCSFADSRVYTDQLEIDCHTKINYYRTVNGSVPTLPADKKMYLAAKNYAILMASLNFTNHFYGGSGPGERLTAAGYPWVDYWGENIGAGYSTGNSIVAAWMASPGHYTNMMSTTSFGKHFTEMACAVGTHTYTNGKKWWVLELSTQATGCGDGFIQGTEACDDGNKVSGDGCSMSCTIEAGYSCTPRTELYDGSICNMPTRAPTPLPTAKPTAQPVQPTPLPTVPTPQPTVPTPQPTVPTPQPTVPTPQPTVPTPQPTVPTPQPSQPTSKPTIPTALPTTATPTTLATTKSPSAPPTGATLGQNTKGPAATTSTTKAPTGITRSAIGGVLTEPALIDTKSVIATERTTSSITSAGVKTTTIGRNGVVDDVNNQSSEASGDNNLYNLYLPIAGAALLLIACLLIALFCLVRRRKAANRQHPHGHSRGTHHHSTSTSRRSRRATNSTMMTPSTARQSRQSQMVRSPFGAQAPQFNRVSRSNRDTYDIAAASAAKYPTPNTEYRALPTLNFNPMVTVNRPIAHSPNSISPAGSPRRLHGAPPTHVAAW